MRRKILGAWVGVLAAAVSSAALAEIRVGTAGPITGPNAFFGVSWMNGMELALREANEAGGVKGQKLVLVRHDDQADPRQGTLIAQRLCDDKDVFGVLAHLNSGVTIPASEIYSRCSLVQITTSSNPRVTAAGHKNVFQTIANDHVQGMLPARHAIQKGLKTAAVVHDKTAFGQGVADLFKQNFEKGGGKVTSVDGVSPNDVDFSAILSKVRLDKPDILYYGGGMPAGGLILKQARALGLNAQYVGADTVFLPDFISTAGQQNAQGALVTNGSPPYDATSELKNFAEVYKKAFGEAPGPYSSYGYAMAKIFIDAVNRAPKLDRAAIIDEVRKTDHTGVLGRIRFNEQGGLQDPILFLYRVEGNEFKLVGDTRGS